jgi:phosphoribosyl 1,2-cyclic phosphodiesterase
MKLKVLGSSSKGNCYILENDSEALILEAGVKFSEVKHALNYNIKKVVGCLITHEHKDHAGHINEVLTATIPVYASAGTIQNTKIEGYRLPLICEAGNLLFLGGFQIIPFATMHDCAEPLGFFINHEETGNILFATDTYYLPCKFAGLNNILIEANYRRDILEANIAAGRLPFAVRNRTLKSHFSYDNCVQALQANDITRVNNIVLIHLSDGNSNAEEFRAGVKKATGGKTVHIAEAGLVINFNKTPF